MRREISRHLDCIFSSSFKLGLLADDGDHVNYLRNYDVSIKWLPATRWLPSCSTHHQQATDAIMLVENAQGLRADSPHVFQPPRRHSSARTSRAVGTVQKPLNGLVMGCHDHAFLVSADGAVMLSPVRRQVQASVRNAQYHRRAVEPAITMPFELSTTRWVKSQRWQYCIKGR